MKTTTGILLGSLLLGVSFVANAQTTPYSVNLVREQVDLACTISTAGAGSVQCSMNINEQGQIAIQMSPETDDSGNPTGGFEGVDQVADGGAEYGLIVAADSSQNVTGVALMRVLESADGSTVNANLSVNSTSSLMAVNISPLIVQAVDAQTYNVTATVFAYSPVGATNMVTAKDPHDLANYVLKQAQPIIKMAQKTQAKH